MGVDLGIISTHHSGVNISLCLPNRRLLSQEGVLPIGISVPHMLVHIASPLDLLLYAS